MVRREQTRVLQRLIHYRDAVLLTQQDNHPVLYPSDLPDVLAARAEYVAQTHPDKPNVRLLTQINSEISAMSGATTHDDVYFLAYDLNKSQLAEGRTDYSAARRKFVRILYHIRDLPRQRREAAQHQSNRIKFQATMKGAREARGNRPAMAFTPW